jgi:hypothetical protein
MRVRINRQRNSPKKQAVIPPNGQLTCYRCGVSYDLKKCLPAPVVITNAIIKAWETAHQNCQETKEGRALRARAEFIAKKAAEYYALRGERD